jgi:1-acyl-sn-glycerol-3-phosphate acyltransferase
MVPNMDETPNAVSRSHTNVFLGFPLWGPLRSLLRLLFCFSWVLLCYAGVRMSGLFFPFTPQKRHRARLAWHHRWLNGMRYFLGLRIRVHGVMPDHPFFMVSNHITWLDYFVYAFLLRDTTLIVQAEDEDMPIAGVLMAAGDPIFNIRSREGVPKTLAKMRAILESGGSIIITPEGVVGPGKEVRRFHAALLESAVQCKIPVHCAAITARTPKGCPPASKLVLFGPDPLFKGPDGRVPQSEIDAWGRPVNSFFLHLLRLLCLPHCEFDIHMAAAPVLRTDRHELAEALRETVQEAFIPVD